MSHARFIVIITLALVLLASPVAAQSTRLADLVPESTLLYGEISSWKAFRAGCESSPLGQMLGHELMKPLMEPIQKLMKQAEEPAQGMFGTDMKGLLGSLDGEISIALLDMGNRNRPVPGLALVVRGTPALDAIVAAFEAFLREQGAPLKEAGDLRVLDQEGEEIYFRCRGGRLVISTDRLLAGQLLAGKALETGSLGHSEQLPDRRTDGASFYVNLEGAIEQAIGMGVPPKRREEMARMLKILGLDALRSLTVTTRSEKEGWTSRLRLAIEGEPRGLLALLAPETAGPQEALGLDRVPERATNLCVFRCNLGQRWNTLLDLVQAFETEKGRELIQAVREFEARAGISISEDLLGRLGQTMTVYTATPPLGGTFRPDTVLQIRSSDGVRFVDALRKLTGSIDMMELTTVDFLGHSIHVLNVLVPPDFLDRKEPPVAMGMAMGMMVAGIPAKALLVEEDRLTIANSSQAIMRLLLERKKGDSKRLVDRSAYRKATQWVGSSDAGMMFYVDTAHAVGNAYNGFVTVFDVAWPFVRGQMPPELREVTFQPAALPPAEWVAQYLPPGVLLVRREPGAFVLETRSFLGPDLGVDMTQIGIAAAMLLPALTAVKEKAQRAKCKSNLKQLGIGIANYADAFNDYYPPFGNPAFCERLLRSGAVSDPSVFDCPSTGDHAGVHYDYATWEKANFGGARVIKNASRIPALWDASIENHEDARCVLFLDGHVEEMSEPQFRAMMTNIEQHFGWKANLDR
ncbi:MAG: DUF1559 domain-containing protein [Planctomycetota bacterium]|nr:DUF1559 domain-containing protein [Planctomycetota bacterium]